MNFWENVNLDKCEFCEYVNLEKNVKFDFERNVNFVKRKIEFVNVACNILK